MLFDDRSRLRILACFAGPKDIGLSAKHAKERERKQIITGFTRLRIFRVFRGP